jgi:leader peptidase (prepilin peptidase) / N-methyltransferase
VLLTALLTAALAIILLAIAWIDLRRHVIPDGLNAAVAGIGCASLVSIRLTSPTDAMLGLALGFAVPFLLARGFLAFRGQAGLGFGDVKFLSAAGFCVGASSLPWLVLIASVSGLSFAIGRHLVDRTAGLQARIAFGPHLALGLFAMWISKSMEII